MVAFVSLLNGSCLLSSSLIDSPSNCVCVSDPNFSPFFSPFLFSGKLAIATFSWFLPLDLGFMSRD